MPISSGDIKWRLTIKTGSAGETAAQPDVNASLGRYASTTDMVDATVGNLFDAVTGDENAAHAVEYRAVFVKNGHGSLTWVAPKAWVSAEVASGADVAIGLDPAGVVASTAVAGVSVADETTAPAGVAFSTPTTKTAGLQVADVPAGSGFMIWVRRSAQDTPPVNADGATIRCEGDTGA